MRCMAAGKRASNHVHSISATEQEHVCQNRTPPPAAPPASLYSWNSAFNHFHGEGGPSRPPDLQPAPMGSPPQHPAASGGDAGVEGERVARIVLLRLSCQQGRLAVVHGSG